MKLCSGRHARWCAHVNGVFATPDMRGWLSDTVSLTRKLIAHSTRFRVERLRQQQGVCLADEFHTVGLARPIRVQEREVLLRCDDRPVVFAHTIVPLAATASDWPFFGTLGERSLGTTLFGDPRVARGTLQYARLHAQHPLVRRASAALGQKHFVSPLFARRCLYRRKNGVLLVTELFLPALADLISLPRHHARLDESTR
ncbi:chorismate--pyruvate lyase family protein [Noviherbaspirillum saxi]|uniref:Probable chorismate pyruvate-lyase n=1 Tax=Noviherbaspirillum saxi TaxID=2320863 RepID=A0A3A3FP34_9BURK|nr:chorismate lyase [Noviherbaspirillum saxi]RJF97776.1 chorismate lyase [Noviherbaspirillum saxi]